MSKERLYYLSDSVERFIAKHALNGAMQMDKVHLLLELQEIELYPKLNGSKLALLGQIKKKEIERVCKERIAEILSY